MYGTKGYIFRVATHIAKYFHLHLFAAGLSGHENALTSQSYDKGYDPVAFTTGSESGKILLLCQFAPNTDSL